MAQRKGRPAAGPRAEAATSLTTPLLGWVAGQARDGRVLVDFDGNVSGPIPAETTVDLAESEIASLAKARRPALLLFDRGDPRRPVIVGLVRPGPGSAMLEAILSGDPGPSATTPAAPAEVRVDGRSVVIEGRDQVTLRCGESSITLRRDGKVEIRGARIVSTSRGTHRIRGGSVQIN